MHYRIFIIIFFSLNLISLQILKANDRDVEIANQEISKAQQLENQLNSAKNDDNAKIDILRKICVEYVDVDNEKLKKYAGSLLQICNKLNNESGKADAYNFLGIVEDIDANFAKALEFYNKSLDLAKKAKKNKLIASVSNNIGLLEWKSGNYKDALSTFFSALKNAELIGSDKIQGNVSSNIGLVFQEINRPLEALQWQKKALKFRLKNKNDYNLASNYNNLANAYSIMKKSDPVFFYHGKAIELQRKIDDKYGLAISYLNAGAEYKNIKNYQKALDYFLKSQSIREELDDRLGLTHTYINLAECYKLMGDIKKAIEFGEQALAVSKNIKSNDRIAESSKSLADTYKISGNLHKAMELQQSYSAYKDKIFNKQMVDKIASLNIKYQTEKKEKELSLVKLKVAQEVLASKQKNLWFVILASFFIVGLLLFRNFTIKSRLKQKQLILKNDLLQEQNVTKTQQQRLEISRDLHDSVGAQLTLISSTLDSLKMRDETNSIRFKDKIYSLTTFVDMSISELRNTLWILNADELFLEDLRLKIVNYINSASIARDDIKFSYQFDITENVKLDSRVVANILRIIQEIITNSLKYSGAGFIDIQITHSSNKLKMFLSDDGKGFDWEKEKETSFGLSNIQKRVSELKGEIRIDTSLIKGTKYTIIIELK